MVSKYNIYDTVITICGIGFTAENFQTAIGIIIGILTLINIIIKSGIEIKKLIDKKKFDKIPELMDKTIEDIKEVKDNAKNK